MGTLIVFDKILPYQYKLKRNLLEKSTQIDKIKITAHANSSLTCAVIGLNGFKQIALLKEKY